MLEISANVLAIAALWIAYLSYKASSRVWLRVIKVEAAGCQSIDENASQLFHYLTITIQNLGIPLSDVSLHLCFICPEQGSYSIQMRRVEFSAEHKIVNGPSDIAQGSAAKYSLKSYKLDESTLRWFSTFQDAKTNNLQLRICTQGFRIVEQRLWHRCYALKSCWNRWAWSINQRFNSERTTKDGRKLLKLGSVVPQFDVESHFRTEDFISHIQSSTVH